MPTTTTPPVWTGWGTLPARLGAPFSPAAHDHSSAPFPSLMDLSDRSNKKRRLSPLSVPSRAGPPTKPAPPLSAVRRRHFDVLVPHLSWC